MNIPEVKKSSGKNGNSGANAPATESADEDDWLDGAVIPPSGGSGGKKAASGGKKKKGKKKGKK